MPLIAASAPVVLVATLSLGLQTCVDYGRLSVYSPRDGYNRGELACGGNFTSKQKHIAYRGWRRVGCGRKVLVYAVDTKQCVLTSVQDSGPFGVTQGKKWKPHVSLSRHPPKGWEWRAITDLSHALWIDLGRPRPLTPVLLFFLPRGDTLELPDSS